MVSLVELEAIDCNGLDQHPWQCLTWLIVWLERICCQRIKVCQWSFNLIIKQNDLIGYLWNHNQSMLAERLCMRFFDKKGLFINFSYTNWTVESVSRRFCLGGLQGSGVPSYRLARCTLEQHHIACSLVHLRAAPDSLQLRTLPLCSAPRFPFLVYALFAQTSVQCSRS